MATINLDDPALRPRWESAIRRELWRWRLPEPCPACGEWVGHHWDADRTREPCPLLPMDVPLEQVRPGCYAVRRHWIGDAIRHACKGA